MKDDHISDLFPEYLDNTLNDSDKQKIEQHLASCIQCKLELDEMKLLFKAFKNDSVSVPSDRLSVKFEAALNQEKAATTKIVSIAPKKEKSNWASNLLKVAASIALLVTSFQIGRVIQSQKNNQELVVLQDETLQFKQAAMLSLMENQSASKRIQGVNYIEEFPNPDEAIVKALTDRLLYDENDNVRLNAFEALSGFTTSETVKIAFIKALEQEKNPSIQVAIIQALVKIQEKKAIGPMQKLLEKEDTQPFIKKEIEQGLPKII
ncbi:HEAT repeat domain-containing protein [Flagellimonas sp. HMM57]|uniref:zf-HC2 domain-containing protein n=1 Tax=unclassified Flagellimonas TaxID=2644544 RepID=UPI0013D33BF9|nr:MULTISPECIES: HEAT repeat domain-containing protein [unclassified Flagellimonas]UII77393.1 HEAT repeat domain-containing protein [Flagellimonas sp. HMM57]